ncbi:hypothetical protein [Pedobacter africanus]|uniref:Phage tail assembly chaperone protein, TAC n=1 Tax=Pedobacter africanus TaxID=151894 RepID=A0A1W1ZBL0_9SPHI|nr:hypothetical protein [Pedobacter africanus]SMC45726.1 hypothetical protein SAMN04488524_0562 [Pedobacter africanus]
MSNPRITFEVEGVKYSLYFGMVATQIITEKSIKAAASQEKSNVKSFAYILFGGLCNAAELVDEANPDFEQAYLLAEVIAGDDDLTSKIYSAWQESKPHKELMDRLNSNKKKAGKQPGKNQKTGMK